METGGRCPRQNGASSRRLKRCHQTNSTSCSSTSSSSKPSHPIADMNDDEDERVVHGRGSTTSMPRIETMNVEQARVVPPTCRQHPGVHGEPPFVVSACIGTMN